MFEGSEKKVEIVFKPGTNPRLDGVDWARVVGKANATILSNIRNSHLDAYLLSESSLFVYDNAVMMITCGTTTLCDAILEIFNYLPRESVALLMYERKNEIAPEEQPSNFESDVARISAVFPGEVDLLGDEDGNHIRLFHHRAEDYTAPDDDITLELLMHDLGEGTRSVFTKAQGVTGVRAATSLDKLLPDFTIDDYVFDPVGYSLNGIGRDSYMTFHVTPEQQCSYASLEINYLFPDVPALQGFVQRVLDIFQPGSASLVLFQSHGLRLSDPTGYRSDRFQKTHRHGYEIIFRNYVRTA